MLHAELPYRDLTSGLLQTLLLVLRPTNKKTTSALVKKLLVECFTYVGSAADDGEKMAVEGEEKKAEKVVLEV